MPGILVVLHATFKLRAETMSGVKSQAGWYHDKAAECNRHALASTNTATRDLYIKERDIWRKIAASIDAADEAVKTMKG